MASTFKQVPFEFAHKSQSSGSLNARIALFNDGYRPVPPLADGRDLWANDDLVCAYRLDGRVIVVMPKFDYDRQRKTMVACAVAIADRLMAPPASTKRGHKR
jgi:hypothetical protein